MVGLFGTCVGKDFIIRIDASHVVGILVVLFCSAPVCLNLGTDRSLSDKCWTESFTELQWTRSVALAWMPVWIFLIFATINHVRKEYRRGNFFLEEKRFGGGVVRLLLIIILLCIINLSQLIIVTFTFSDNGSPQSKVWIVGLENGVFLFFNCFYLILICRGEYYVKRRSNGMKFIVLIMLISFIFWALYFAAQIGVWQTRTSIWLKIIEKFFLAFAIIRFIGLIWPEIERGERTDWYGHDSLVILSFLFANILSITAAITQLSTHSYVQEMRMFSWMDIEIFLIMQCATRLLPIISSLTQIKRLASICHTRKLRRESIGFDLKRLSASQLESQAPLIQNVPEEHSKMEMTKQCCNPSKWVNTIERWIVGFPWWYVLFVSVLLGLWGAHKSCYVPSGELRSSKFGTGLFLARFGATPFLILIPFEIFTVAKGFQTLLQSTVMGTFLGHDKESRSALSQHKKVIPTFMMIFLVIHIVGHLLIKSSRNEVDLSVLPNSLEAYVTSFDNGSQVPEYYYPWFTGWAAVSCLVMTLFVYLFSVLPRCKICPDIFPDFLAFSQFINFHKFFAYSFIFLISIHGIGNSWIFPPMQFIPVHMPAYLFAGGLMLLNVYLSWPRICNMFTFSFTLFIGAFFLVCPWPLWSWSGYFGKSVAWVSVSFVMIVYLINRLRYRLSATSLDSIVFLMDNAAQRIEKSENWEGYLLISIPKEGNVDKAEWFKYFSKGGEWAMLRAPSLGIKEWRPFTAIRTINGLVFHISIKGGATRALAKECMFLVKTQDEAHLNVSASEVARKDLNIGAELNLSPASVQLEVAGPYFGVLTSDDIKNRKLMICIALGVGFTGCAGILTKENRKVIFLHRCRRSPFYAEYAKKWMAIHRDWVEFQQANEDNRSDFWERIEKVIMRACSEDQYQPQEVGIAYCGNDAGLTKLHDIREKLIRYGDDVRENKKEFRQLRIYAESFG